jgi:tetratricopeptide (TPR) repeat protein
MGKTNSKPDSTTSFDHNKSVKKSVGGREKNLSSNKAHQPEKNAASSIVKSPRFVENIILIWLDSSLEKMTESTQKMVNQVRRVTNIVQTFSDSDKCVEFIQSIRDQKIFIVVSGSLGPQLLPRIENFSQVHSVYVFCGNKAKHQLWTKDYRQIKSLHIQMKDLCETLRRDIRQYDNSITPISILPSGPIVELNEANREFICLQVIKSILLGIQSDKKFRKEFISYYRQFYLNNEQQLTIIDTFEENYQVHSPNWWYTRKCFIYSMLRKAFLFQDIEIIYKASFFIRDLHRDIKKAYLQTHNHQYRSISVYRATGITSAQYKNIEANQGGLLSINDFFISTLERTIALKFANILRTKSDTIGIIFKFDIDPSTSTIPYIALTNLSYLSDTEGEILFSMNTIFRIDQISKVHERLYEITLTPASKDHESIKSLIDYMQETTTGLSGWYKLGRVMVEINQYQQVESIYKYMSETTDAQHWEERAFLQHELGYIADLKNDLTASVQHYKQSIDIYLTYLPATHPSLLSTYVNLATVLKKQGDLRGALEQYNYALKTEIPDDPNVVVQYNNIAKVLQQQGKMSEAQQTYDKAVKILLTDFPSAHPVLADTYHNMGGMFYASKDYKKALSYYEKTLDIEETSFLSNHPSLASTYFNIATAYEGLKDYKRAINYAEKAVQVARLAFGAEHEEAKENLDYLDNLQKNTPNDQLRL